VRKKAFIHEIALLLQKTEIMKKRLLILFTVLSAIGYGVVPTSGLIGRWEFSGNANDGSPSVNNGTVFGAVLCPDRCGNANRAYRFNGTSDYILMLAAGPTGTVSRSVSFWVRTTNTVTGVKASFDYGTPNSNGGSFEVNWNYCKAGGVGIDNSSSATNWSNTGSCLNDGAWHHIVAVFDATTSTSYLNVLFYADGVLLTNNCTVGGIGVTMNTGSTFPITIGKACNASTRFFKGDLDDIYLYNRALTYAEIQQLYTNNACPPSITGPSPATCTGATYSIAPVVGASSYSWSLPAGWGGISSTNIINTTPSNNSGVISVTVLNTCGASLGTYTMAVAVNIPTISASASPTSICQGQCAVLTASGATSYTWMPGSLTGNAVTVCPGTTTTYTVTGGTNGCTSSISLAVQVNPTIAISISGPSVYCTNLGGGITLTANTSPSPPGLLYSWSPVAGTASVLTDFPSTTTIYTVTVTAGSCVTQATYTVSLLSNCCPTTYAYPIVSGSFVTGGATLTGNYVVNQSFTIGANPSSITQFENGEILLSKDAKITVMPGHELRLKGVHMYACSADMWDGIEILDGANIRGMMGSIMPNDLPVLIEDAKTAIDLSNINTPYSPNPIDLSNVIFNKNFIGIKISNSPLNALPINLQSCVFTSRSLTFTPTNWVKTWTFSNGLRSVVNPTTGLKPPYYVQNYSFSNLLNPYNNQPSYCGIRIENFGNVPGSMPSTGVEIEGVNNNPGAGDFNLFDALGRGIDVEDASLSTMNNVFQIMRDFTSANGQTYGRGIYHLINGQMNAGLYLSPVSPNATDYSYGNRFWDCYEGVHTENVFDMDVEYGIYRSEQCSSNGGGWGQGYNGIYNHSNRFQHNMLYNDFNNIAYPITMTVQNGPYFIGSPQNGVYAGPVNIKENYFGPAVNSTLALNCGYVQRAVSISGQNNIGTQITSGISIHSNKMNRVYNGIYLFGLDAYPVEVLGNLLSIEDDIMNFATQRGIEVTQTLRGIVVSSNTLTGSGKTNTNVALVYCENNQGPKSPVVTCNDASVSYKGFQFDQQNPGTDWEGNKMQNLAFGLYLSTNALINQQGNPSLSSANEWNGTWSTPDFCTYADMSNPLPSALYIDPSSPFVPTLNGGTTVGIDYNMPGALIINPAGTPLFQCNPTGLPAPPSYRLFSPAAASNAGITDADLIDLYPNPASDHLTVRSSNAQEKIQIRIMDISGKMLFSGEVNTSNHHAQLQLNLQQGLYFTELKGENGNCSLIKLSVMK
jgi:hypothetical protein